VALLDVGDRIGGLLRRAGPVDGQVRLPASASLARFDRSPALGATVKLAIACLTNGR
jgi:hypothetical protein